MFHEHGQGGRSLPKLILTANVAAKWRLCDFGLSLLAA